MTRGVTYISILIGPTRAAFTKSFCSYAHILSGYQPFWFISIYGPLCPEQKEINWRSSRELHSKATLQREWLFLCNKTVLCSMRPLPPRRDAEYHVLSWNIIILTYSQGLLALSSPFRFVFVFVFPAVVELCNPSWLLYTILSRHISSIIYRYPSYMILLLTYSYQQRFTSHRFSCATIYLRFQELLHLISIPDIRFSCAPSSRFTNYYTCVSRTSHFHLAGCINVSQLLRRL